MNKESEDRIAQKTAEIIFKQISQIVLVIIIVWVVSSYRDQILFFLALPTFYLFSLLKINPSFTNNGFIDIIIFIAICCFVNFGVVVLIFGAINGLKEAKKTAATNAKMERLKNISENEGYESSVEIANQLDLFQTLHSIIDDIKYLPIWFKNSHKWASNIIPKTDLTYLTSKGAKKKYPKLDIAYIKTEQEILEYCFDYENNKYILLSPKNSIYDSDAPPANQDEVDDEDTYFTVGDSYPVIIVKNHTEIVLKAKLFTGTQVWTEHGVDSDYFRGSKIETIKAGRWIHYLTNIKNALKQESSEKVKELMSEHSKTDKKKGK